MLLTTNGKSELNSQPCFARFGRYSAVSAVVIRILKMHWAQKDPAHRLIFVWVHIDPPHCRTKANIARRPK